eukprot:jgi/Psemu1/300325/fgenesh1_kg.10_\
MKPSVKTAVATMQQVGRRFSSAYAANSRNGIRGVGSSMLAPSTSSQQHSLKASTETATQLSRLTQHVVAAVAAQRRAKSSMAI